MKVGDLMKVSRDDIQDFPGDTVDLIMDIQKKGWRAQRSNRNHVTLLAPDGITRYSASRNANSAKYLAEDIRRYEKKVNPEESEVHDHVLTPYGNSGKYRCNICGGNTFTEEDLPMSARSKFPCPQAGCVKFYASQEKLNIHLAVDHEGHRKCPDCDYTAKTPQAIGRHRQTVHGHVSPRYKQRKQQEVARAEKAVEKIDIPETPEEVAAIGQTPIEVVGYGVKGMKWGVKTVKPEDAEPLEFIDERDSWTINLDGVSDQRVGKLQKTLEAAGLKMEIRVWQP